MRRINARLLAGILVILILGTSCSNIPDQSAASTYSEENLYDPNKPLPTLIYYTIGIPDEDLPLVNEELNLLLKDKIGVQIDYNKIAWNDYGNRLASIISSGTPFDLAFASGKTQGDYAGNAKRNVWMNLTPYLATINLDLYRAVDERYWEGVKVNGRIYGVPSNKEIAVPQWWIYPKALIDKYDIDIDEYTTLASLDPLFALIKENEPDFTVMQLSQDSYNFFELDDYEYLFDKDIPLMVQSTDPEAEIINIYETELGVHTLAVLRDYYQKGYINRDAAITHDRWQSASTMFWSQSGAGPHPQAFWSKERGYPVVAKQVSSPTITTESTRGGIMVVSAKSKYVEESVRFLECLNTDPDIRNTINYGVYGVHYTLNDNDQVVVKNKGYHSQQYTQGNHFILHTMEGDPIDKWDVFRTFNAESVPSVLLGYEPEIPDHPVNGADISQIIDDITAVSEKYYAPLMTGTVDPEVILPLYLQELREAGIDQLKEYYQDQINNWLN